MSAENLENISIELVDETERDAVLDVLRESFYKYEPLCQCHDITNWEELEEFSVSNLVEKCSFKAVNSKGEIVALALNRIAKRESDEKPPTYTDPNVQKIVDILTSLEHQLNIFDKYPNENAYLDVCILTTMANYRGLGLAAKLMEQTMEYMRNNQLNIVLVLCTSHYSARVCEKLHFNNVFRLPYVDYKVNGETVFQPAKPHEAVQMYLMKI